MAHDFINKLNAVQKAVKRLPKIVGNEAVLFSKQRFQQTNWIGDTTENWKKRKPGWVVESKESSRRNVLTGPGSGRLRKSIRVVSENSEKVVIGTDVPYASIHNTGGRYTANQRVRSHKRKEHRRGLSTVRATTVKGYSRTLHINMPKRQFIGNSSYLTKRMIRIASAELNKVL